MSDQVIVQPPSAWAEYSPIITGLIRTVLAALGAAGFTWAQSVTGSQVEMMVSAALVLIAGGWSVWQKIDAVRQARKLAEAAAVASAQATQQAGEPVAVVPSRPATGTPPP